jgi:mitogen-activated protein kinase 15
MHSAQVIHRDLKPSNLLLNSECLVKLADFGLARSISSANPTKEEKPTQILTDYVATRWYRAPEILLGSTTYTEGVDMWSVGCILGELIGGKPMFPGASTTNQIDRIIEVISRPSKEDISAIDSEFAAHILDNLLEPQHPRTLESMYPMSDNDAIDFMRKLLTFNPLKRMSAAQALEHPFVAQFHAPEEEIECKKKIIIPIDDNKKLSVAAYREELYNSIIKVKTVEPQKKKEANSPPPTSSKSKRREPRAQRSKNPESRSKSNTSGTAKKERTKKTTKDHH